MQSILKALTDENNQPEKPTVTVVALVFPWYNLRGLCVRIAQLLFGCNRLKHFSHVVVVIKNPNDEQSLVIDTHNNPDVPTQYKTNAPLASIFLRYPSFTQWALFDIVNPELGVPLATGHCSRTHRYPLIRMGKVRGVTCTTNVELLMGLEPKGRSVSEVLLMLVNRSLLSITGEN